MGSEKGQGLLDMFQSEFKKMHAEMIEKELRLFHQLFQHMLDNTQKLVYVEQFLEQQFDSFEGPVRKLGKKRNKRRKDKTTIIQPQGKGDWNIRGEGHAFKNGRDADDDAVIFENEDFGEDDASRLGDEGEDMIIINPHPDSVILEEEEEAEAFIVAKTEPLTDDEEEQDLQDPDYFPTTAGEDTKQFIHRHSTPPENKIRLGARVKLHEVWVHYESINKKDKIYSCKKCRKIYYRPNMRSLKRHLVKCGILKPETKNKRKTRTMKPKPDLTDPATATSSTSTPRNDPILPDGSPQPVINENNINAVILQPPPPE